MTAPEQMDCEVLVANDPDNVYSTLQNLEVEKKIGKGQFSEVFRAKCILDSSVIALKKVQVGSPFTSVIM